MCLWACLLICSPTEVKKKLCDQYSQSVSYPESVLPALRGCDQRASPDSDWSVNNLLHHRRDLFLLA